MTIVTISQSLLFYSYYLSTCLLLSPVLPLFTWHLAIMLRCIRRSPSILARRNIILLKLSWYPFRVPVSAAETLSKSLLVVRLSHTHSLKLPIFFPNLCHSNTFNFIINGAVFMHELLLSVRLTIKFGDLRKKFIYLSFAGCCKVGIVWTELVHNRHLCLAHSERVT